MGRIMIFTGKGGVGKTSVAAAHARKSAQEGKRTLLVSTDMAHNLGDIFDMELGREEKEVVPDLFVLEIDPYYIMEHNFRDIGESIGKMMSSMGMDSAANDLEISSFPGMDELFSLLKIQEIYETGKYERIIVDCAPTGETLTLLKFPELLSWYMEKFFPIEKIALRVLRPVSKTVFKVELPNQKAMDDVETMYLKLARLQQLLKNREVTSIRLVAIPEKMVVEETKRNFMYMNLYDFQVDGLYINRVLPPEAENTFFGEWKKIQKGYKEELEAVFSEVPVYSIPWFDSDLNGLEGIDRIAGEILEGKEVFRIVNYRQAQHYQQKGGQYQLELYVPCIRKEELDIHESDRDIILKAGNFKRNIPKPDTLRRYEISEAVLEDEVLRIVFSKEEEDE